VGLYQDIKCYIRRDNKIYTKDDLVYFSDKNINTIILNYPCRIMRDEYDRFHVYTLSKFKNFILAEKYLIIFSDKNNIILNKKFVDITLDNGVYCFNILPMIIPNIGKYILWVIEKKIIYLYQDYMCNIICLSHKYVQVYNFEILPFNTNDIITTKECAMLYKHNVYGNGYFFNHIFLKIDNKGLSNSFIAIGKLSINNISNELEDLSNSDIEYCKSKNIKIHNITVNIKNDDKKKYGFIVFLMVIVIIFINIILIKPSFHFYNLI